MPGTAKRRLSQSPSLSTLAVVSTPGAKDFEKVKVCAPFPLAFRTRILSVADILIAPSSAFTARLVDKSVLNSKDESGLVEVLLLLLAEACHGKWHNAGFHTTCNHHISISITDHSKSITNSMSTGRTSSGDSMVWTLRGKEQVHVTKFFQQFSPLKGGDR